MLVALKAGTLIDLMMDSAMKPTALACCIPMKVSSYNGV